ncbi:MAG: metallophosphoesterase [Microbacteriaceae bacterium]|nr:metallophosphoesterase [Microbacteriaceae bacterium]
MQLGQHPAPSHTIAHFSDPHLLSGGGLLYGSVDTVAHLREALELLEGSPIRPDAIVFTGDLADLGEDDAYERLAAAVVPVAARMGAQLIWGMGNHDERAPYARHLFGDHGPDGNGATVPQDRVYDVGGLRIIALDTSVPGYHHGELDPAQLQWLAEQLASPAPHGTLLTMHHPPIPTPLDELFSVIELQDQSALAEVVRGTDVRGILGGHLHYSTHSTFAGVPVSVASATCYTMALANPRLLAGVDAGQSIDIVSVYEDRLVHTTMPIAGAELISGIAPEAFAHVGRISPEERREMFSRKGGEARAAAALAEAGLADGGLAEAALGASPGAPSATA